MSKHVMISTQWFHLAVPIGNATTWESVYILDPQWSHDSHMGDCLFNWFSLIGTWQQGSHMTRACSTWREGVWDMTSSLWPAPWGAYRSQHSIWSLANWSMWLIKGLLWKVSKLEVWEVNWVRSVLCHELKHSRNQSMSSARSLWR